MVNVYERIARNPVVRDAWKVAPVQFEVCGTLQEWHDRGFDLDRILEKGLEWHISVLNAKSSPIPTEWNDKFSNYLKQIGYRFVLLELSHETSAPAGGTLRVRSRWRNKGVAPIYHPWPLAYRLRSGGDRVAVQWKSGADLKRWLPGDHEVDDVLRVPPAVPEGSYSLDVAILDQEGSGPHVEIAISGRRPDGWYPVSTVAINNG